jgi:simple sugar transport system permease protein
LLGFKITERLEVSRRSIIAVTILAYIVSPLVVLAVLAGAGKSPLVTLDALYRGTIGTVAGFAESIVQATPLMLMALGLVIAFRCKVWNIGAEGQQIFGAIVVTWFVLPFLKDPMPSYVMIPAALILSLLGGGLFAAIPALMKSRLGINEVITTIMMNYVAIDALNWLVRGPFQDKSIPGSYPESPIFPPATSLPILLQQTSVTVGIIISVALCVLGYYILFKTPLGYSIRAVGLNLSAARTSGISVKRVVNSAMVLSGALAGLGGGVYILGVTHELLPEQSSGLGYTAVVVALLGNLHPLGVIFSSVFFGGLISGMSSVERALQIPRTLSLFSQGIIIVLILIIQVLARYEIRRG